MSKLPAASGDKKCKAYEMFGKVCAHPHMNFNMPIVINDSLGLVLFSFDELLNLLTIEKNKISDLAG